MKSRIILFLAFICSTIALINLRAVPPLSFVTDSFEIGVKHDIHTDVSAVDNENGDRPTPPPFFLDGMSGSDMQTIVMDKLVVTPPRSNISQILSEKKVRFEEQKFNIFSGGTIKQVEIGKIAMSFDLKYDPESGFVRLLKFSW